MPRRLRLPRICLLLLASAMLLLLATSLRAQNQIQNQTLPELGAAGPLGEELFLRSGSTGMLLVVVRGKEVFLRGYGETYPGSGQTPGPTSLVRLCSLSKIFATDLLVKLSVQGLVRLDDPLSRFAPTGAEVPSRNGRPITLGDLATHTAGLPREVGPAPAGAAHFTFPGYAYRWRWLPGQTLKTEPGTAALYSNIGFDLLGDALAAATHEPYARLLAERTTGPLAMRETGFSPTPAQCARLLGGAHDEGACTDTQSSAGSSGLYSTAADMGRWLRYLLGTDQPAIPAQNPAAQAVYLDPAQLTRVQGLDHAGDAAGIGLGWIHTPGPYNPDAASIDTSITEKTGGGAGFLTYIALNQARHTAIFVAATDGSVETHLSLARAANNVLLTMAGLPLLPEPPQRPPTIPKPRKPAMKQKH